MMKLKKNIQTSLEWKRSPAAGGSQAAGEALARIEVNGEAQLEIAVTWNYKSPCTPNPLSVLGTKRRPVVAAET